MRANFVVSGVWAGIRRNLSMTVALILSTSIALAFVGAAYLATVEIKNFKHNYEGKLNVSVFLCGSVQLPDSPCKGQTTKAQRTALQQALNADKRVASATYVSEKQQYQRAIRIEAPNVAAATRLGDLPASFTVRLKDVQHDFDSFSSTYRAKAGVSGVSNQVQALQRLLDVIDGARYFSLMIAVVVLIASILLIANTIQVAAAQRKNETSIMRLVGASRWMTELPFMLETVVATILGGLISVALIAIGKRFVLNGIFQVQVERGVIPNLSTNDVLVAGGVGLLAGIVLAAITAFFTLRVYVRL